MREGREKWVSGEDGETEEEVRKMERERTRMMEDGRMAEGGGGERREELKEGLKGGRMESSDIERERSRERRIRRGSKEQ